MRQFSVLGLLIFGGSLLLCACGEAATTAPEQTGSVVPVATIQASPTSTATSAILPATATPIVTPITVPPTLSLSPSATAQSGSKLLSPGITPAITASSTSPATFRARPSSTRIDPYQGFKPVTPTSFLATTFQQMIAQSDMPELGTISFEYYATTAGKDQIINYYKTQTDLLGFNRTRPTQDQSLPMLNAVTLAVFAKDGPQTNDAVIVIIAGPLDATFASFFDPALQPNERLVIIVQPTVNPNAPTPTPKPASNKTVQPYPQARTIRPIALFEQQLTKQLQANPPLGNIRLKTSQEYYATTDQPDKVSNYYYQELTGAGFAKSTSMNFDVGPDIGSARLDFYLKMSQIVQDGIYGMTVIGPLDQKALDELKSPDLKVGDVLIIIMKLSVL